MHLDCLLNVIRYLERHLNFMLNLTGAQYNICLTKPWTLLSSANGFILFIDSVNAEFTLCFSFLFLFILERFVCLHTNRGLDAVYKCQRFYSLLFLNTVYWDCWPQLWQKPKTVLLKAFSFHPDRSPADHHRPSLYSDQQSSHNQSSLNSKNKI